MNFVKIAHTGTIGLICWVLLTTHDHGESIAEIREHSRYQTAALKRQDEELTRRGAWMRQMNEFKGFVLSELRKKEK